MKGKTLVIGVVLFVLLIVGGIYFSMMATINKIKEEGAEDPYATVESVEINTGILYMLN